MIESERNLDHTMDKLSFDRDQLALIWIMKATANRIPSPSNMLKNGGTKWGVKPKGGCDC